MKILKIVSCTKTTKLLTIGSVIIIDLISFKELTLNTFESTI